VTSVEFNYTFCTIIRILFVLLCDTLPMVAEATQNMSVNSNI